MRASTSETIPIPNRPRLRDYRVHLEGRLDTAKVYKAFTPPEAAEMFVRDIVTDLDVRALLLESQRRAFPFVITERDTDKEWRSEAVLSFALDITMDGPDWD